MYAIMGITGKVGGAVAQALLRSGKKVRGIVRDEAKAVAWKKLGVELAVAEAQDAKALEAAFRGTEGAFVMVPPNFTPAPGYPEARAVAAALKQALEAAGTGKVVALSSIGGQHDKGTGLILQCHYLEQALRSLSTATAFVRAAWFFENFQWDIVSAQERGEINAYLSPVDRGFPMIATEDIGELCAMTLAETWTGSRILELEAERRYSMRDAAEAFAQALGKKVVPVEIPHSAWAAHFEAQGMPADRIAPRIEMVDGFNSGWIEFQRESTGYVQGKRTLEEVVRGFVSAGR